MMQMAANIEIRLSERSRYGCSKVCSRQKNARKTTTNCFHGQPSSESTPRR